MFAPGLGATIDRLSQGFSGVLALYARDLRDGDELQVDADRVCETASVIKVPILVALSELVEAGRLGWETTVAVRPENRTTGSGVLADLEDGLRLRISDLASLMIVVSDNVATNELIDRVGLEAVNAAMERRGLRQTRLHKKLFWNLPGPLGTTTPREMAELMVAIRDGRCVSPAADARMLAILRRQHFNAATLRRFPYALVAEEDAGLRPAVAVASKSGSLPGVRNDVALVSTPAGDYVVSMFTAGCRDPRYHVDNEALLLLPRVSRAILDAFLAGGRG
ncbi:MAG: serine hydrolase [Clostridia bacterium]|nr:serine hydrolase [Clostridia bacterium]